MACCGHILWMNVDPHTQTIFQKCLCNHQCMKINSYARYENTKDKILIWKRSIISSMKKLYTKRVLVNTSICIAMHHFTSPHCAPLILDSFSFFILSCFEKNQPIVEPAAPHLSTWQLTVYQNLANDVFRITLSSNQTPGQCQLQCSNVTLHWRMQKMSWPNILKLLQVHGATSQQSNPKHLFQHVLDLLCDLLIPPPRDITVPLSSKSTLPALNLMLEMSKY